MAHKASVFHQAIKDVAACLTGGSYDEHGRLGSHLSNVTEYDKIAPGGSPGDRVQGFVGRANAFHHSSRLLISPRSRQPRKSLGETNGAAPYLQPVLPIPLRY